MTEDQHRFGNLITKLLNRYERVEKWQYNIILFSHACQTNKHRFRAQFSRA